MSSSSSNLSPIESAKRLAAHRAVADHFSPQHHYIGIGSGSTIVYGVEAIASTLKSHPSPHPQFFIPTGFASRKVIEAAGLTPLPFDSLPPNTTLDVAFDGADEVDPALNCIKGGGACLFQEKLVACAARKFIVIADYRKDQAALLANWPTIPIEVAPIAHAAVARELTKLGSPEPKLRLSKESQTGPVQTDQGFYIIDAPFKPLVTEGGADGKDGVWEVNALAKRIKAINGVLEVGLFHGMNGIQAQAAGLQGGQKPVAVYFGLENGDVSTKFCSELQK